MLVSKTAHCLSSLICIALFSHEVLAAGAASRGAHRVLQKAEINAGLVVVLGCEDGQLAAALRKDDRFVVHALAHNQTAVEAARSHIQSHKLQGVVTVSFHSGARLPYADNLVNLLIVLDAGNVTADEMLRVLAPHGVKMKRNGDGWSRTVKPWPADMDQWTHFLHGPDNNAVARDARVGVPRSLQWVAAPRWGRSHEELAGMSAAVTANGRIFYIIDEAPLASIRFHSRWQLVARDAFNGILLWKRPISRWVDHLRHFRSGPAHLPRRLVADGNRVYTTLALDGPVLALDAKTGKTVHEYADSARTEEILLADGLLHLVTGTSERNRRGGGLKERGEPKASVSRTITVLEADGGRKLWSLDVTDDDILPLTLARSGDRLFYRSVMAMVCLDARSGRRIWRTPRPGLARRMGFSAPTLVATRDVILCADRTPGKGAALQPSTGTIEWGIEGWNEKGFARKSPSTLRAYDAATGRELWAVPCREGYNSPVDLFVVKHTVWVGPGWKGYDVKTGKHVGTVNTTAPRVGMAHHRCYRDKATERFIFTGKSGVEVLDYEKGWLSNNSWVRGTCQYGVIPANGLLYAPPDACACFLTLKQPGFLALAPQRGERPGMAFPDKPVLVRTSQMEAELDDTAAAPTDWPMYRHDPGRSGVATGFDVPEYPALSWMVAVGPQPTQPVTANGRVFVATPSTHAIHALAADSGRTLWTFTAEGAVDSAPTYWRGRLLFGSSHGWVHCLSAASGKLLWRFRAAPEERLVMAGGRLESAWPVHGAVLIQNGHLYTAAGRSSYLDGGLAIYKLDPATGRQLGRTTLYHLDPDTGRQLVPERGFNTQGTTSDILSGNGAQIFLRHFTFDSDLGRTASKSPHLFAITGLLGEEWFVRSYWVYATKIEGAGWGGWAKNAEQNQFGRILCIDEKRIYGYGRRQIASARTGHWGDATHLYAADKKHRIALDRKGGKRLAKAKPTWEDTNSLMVRAMTLAGKRLAVAGPPDAGRKQEDLLAFENETEALEDFRGGRGTLLRIVRADDGARVSEVALAAMPMFDGMSAANGRLYLALKDGSVACFTAGDGASLPRSVTALPPVTDPPPLRYARKPGSTASRKMPNLKGADRRADFARVDAAAIVSAKLGYRLASKKDKPAFAIRKLDAPETGVVTLIANIRPTSRPPGYFENAYVAFGDGTNDANLIKCGMKFVMSQATIITGATTGGSATNAKIDFDRTRDTKITIVADLPNHTVTLKVGGKTLTAKLPKTLTAITHVGYCQNNAISDYSAIR